MAEKAQKIVDLVQQLVDLQRQESERNKAEGLPTTREEVREKARQEGRAPYELFGRKRGEAHKKRIDEVLREHRQRQQRRRARPTSVPKRTPLRGPARSIPASLTPTRQAPKRAPRRRLREAKRHPTPKRTPPPQTPPSRWRATENLLGAAGGFIPALGQLANLMRGLRQFGETFGSSGQAGAPRPAPASTSKASRPTIPPVLPATPAATTVPTGSRQASQPGASSPTVKRGSRPKPSVVRWNKSTPPLSQRSSLPGAAKQSRRARQPKRAALAGTAKPPQRPRRLKQAEAKFQQKMQHGPKPMPAARPVRLKQQQAHFQQRQQHGIPTAQPIPTAKPVRLKQREADFQSQMRHGKSRSAPPIGASWERKSARGDRRSEALFRTKHQRKSAAGPALRGMVSSAHSATPGRTSTPLSSGGGESAAREIVALLQRIANVLEARANEGQQRDTGQLPPKEEERATGNSTGTHLVRSAIGNAKGSDPAGSAAKSVAKEIASGFIKDVLTKLMFV